MIYKRIKVAGLLLKPGQIIGAPIAPQPILAPLYDGSPEISNYLSSAQVMFEGVKIVNYINTSGGDIDFVEPRYDWVGSMTGEVDSFDISSRVYIELKGHFHSTPLVMYEASLQPGKSGLTLLRRDEANDFTFYKGDQVLPSTLARHGAYMILTPVRFTGEIICHNTIQDRVEPFRFPLCAMGDAQYHVADGVVVNADGYAINSYQSTVVETAADVDAILLSSARVFSAVGASPDANSVGLGAGRFTPRSIANKIPAQPLDPFNALRLVGLLRPSDSTIRPVVWQEPASEHSLGLPELRGGLRCLPWSDEGAALMLRGVRPFSIPLDPSTYAEAENCPGIVLMFRTVGQVPLRWYLALSPDLLHALEDWEAGAGDALYDDESTFLIGPWSRSGAAPGEEYGGTVLSIAGQGLDIHELYFLRCSVEDFLSGKAQSLSLGGLGGRYPNPVLAELINSDQTI